MNNDQDTLRDEYSEDLIKSGVSGKYTKRYLEGTNIVLIDPDLYPLFPDSEAVTAPFANISLRSRQKKKCKILQISLNRKSNLKEQS